MQSFQKIFLFAVMSLVALPAGAQIVSSSSMVIMRKKLPDVKPGYEQSIDLSYSMLTDGNTALTSITSAAIVSTMHSSSGSEQEWNIA